MSNKKTSATLIAIDDGHAEMKGFTEDGRMLKIPSRARAGIHELSSINGESATDGGYTTEGKPFTVSEHINGEETRFDEYPTSALNRVMVHHTLRLLDMGGKTVKLATGLPVQAFFIGSKPNADLIKRKKDNLLIEVKSLDDEPCATIVEPEVFSEGIAAWLDFAINDSGKWSKDAEVPVGIIDIGGRTTDCVTILPKGKGSAVVDHAASGTANVGVLDLYEVISMKIRGKFNIDGVVSQAKVQEAVLTGNFRVFGKDHDIKDIVDAAKVDVGDRILREAQRRFGKGAELDTVLLVGGGSNIFDNLLADWFRHSVKPENPEFSNARGMLKFMKFVMDR